MIISSETFSLLIQISTVSYLIQILKLHHIGGCSKLVTDAETSGVKPAGESETEEGGACDAGAEFTGRQLLFLTPDERISRWRRLYKKRANMSLVFYHKSHPVSSCFALSVPTRSSFFLSENVLFISVLFALFLHFDFSLN